MPNPAHYGRRQLRGSLAPQRARRATALLGLGLVFLSGCAVLDYGRDRVLDLTDIVNVKYGASSHLALGTKVELTDFFGTGIGLGARHGVREFYGRRLGKSDTFFLHSPLYGYDGAEADPDVYVMLVGLSGWKGTYPLMERWRFGGEITLPFVTGGLYFNAAEVVDFIVGLFTLDPAEDDELPFADEMKDPRLEEMDGETRAEE